MSTAGPTYVGSMYLGPGGVEEDIANTRIPLKPETRFSLPHKQCCYAHANVRTVSSR